MERKKKRKGNGRGQQCQWPGEDERHIVGSWRMNGIESVENATLTEL